MKTRGKFMKSDVTPEQRAAFSEWLRGKHIAMMQHQSRYIDQNELSRLLGIHPSLISKYLQGQSIPGDGKTVQIANFFNDDTVYDLLGYDRPAVRPDAALAFVRHNLAETEEAYFNKFIEEVEKVRRKRNL